MNLTNYPKTNLFNQILKTAIRYLLSNDGVDGERKIALKKVAGPSLMK